MRSELAVGLAVICVGTWAQAELPPPHPRLLFDADGRAALRKKVRSEPYAAMCERIVRLAESQAFDPAEHSSVLYDTRIRQYAQAYALTGERGFARKAERAALKFIADREFWNDRRSKGLTRAAGALSVAIAYDLCQDVWRLRTRARVSRELLEVARGLMRSMGRGANTKVANNWQGVRYGAAGLAALACDESGRLELARKAYAGLKRHLHANLGNSGWNPEGIGYTVYPATFTGPFGIAARRAGIGDVREDEPRFGLTFWTTLVGTVPIRHLDGLGLRADLVDDHPKYAGIGTAGLAFYYAPDEQVPAIKWMYDRFFGRMGDRSWDADEWGGGIYSVLFYPADVEARNPERVLGLNYVDESHGLVTFRNRYRDAEDVVAVVNAHSRQPPGCHRGPDTNTFRIIGLGAPFVVGGGRTRDTAGQTNLFAGRPAERGTGGLGELVDYRFSENGGGRTVTRGSCTGVKGHVRRFVADYSGTAGVPAVFLDAETSRNGRLWRLNTPEFNEIDVGDDGFVIRSPAGSSLAATVLEPAQATFRTGEVERGGGMDHVAFPYRGKKYAHNKWVEFECKGRACVVMTLQKEKIPAVAVERSLHGAEARVGRIEPRVLKRRRHGYPLMQRPRARLRRRAG